MTSEAEGLTTERVLDEIFAERARRRDQEGHGSEEDDERAHGELAAAGAAYALMSMSFWKCDDKDDCRKILVEAAAILVAEIERLDRACGTQRSGEP